MNVSSCGWLCAEKYNERRWPEPATSDVKRRKSGILVGCIFLDLKGLADGAGGVFRGATVAATVRHSVFLLRDFDFAVDQLHRLFAELREEMFVAVQRLALVPGVLGNHVIRHPLAQ